MLSGPKIRDDGNSEEQSLNHMPLPSFMDVNWSSGGSARVSDPLLACKQQISPNSNEDLVLKMEAGSCEEAAVSSSNSSLKNLALLSPTGQSPPSSLDDHHGAIQAELLIDASQTHHHGSHDSVHTRLMFAEEQAGDLWPM